MGKSIIRGLAILLILTACAPAANTAPLETRLSALEAQVNKISALEGQVTTLQQQVTGAASSGATAADLQSRLDTLEAKLEGMALPGGEPATGTDAAMHEGSPFEMAVAQYVMDTAGFHGMADTLSETKKVDPAYLGTVNRVHNVLASAPWPAALAEQGQAFVTLLEDFGKALEADDGEESATLADQVHEAQHDLSHAIDEWLGAGGDAH